MWSGLLAVSCAMWVINPEHMQQVVEWLRERNSILKKMGVLSDLGSHRTGCTSQHLSSDWLPDQGSTMRCPKILFADTLFNFGMALILLRFAENPDAQDNGVGMLWYKTKDPLVVDGPVFYARSRSWMMPCLRSWSDVLMIISLCSRTFFRFCGFK